LEAYQAHWEAMTNHMSGDEINIGSIRRHFEHVMIDMINSYRKKDHGYAPFHYDTTLTKQTAHHARVMIEYDTLCHSCEGDPYGDYWERFEHFKKVDNRQYEQVGEVASMSMAGTYFVNSQKRYSLHEKYLDVYDTTKFNDINYMIAIRLATSWLGGWKRSPGHHRSILKHFNNNKKQLMGCSIHWRVQYRTVTGGAEIVQARSYAVCTHAVIDLETKNKKER